MVSEQPCISNAITYQTISPITISKTETALQRGHLGFKSRWISNVWLLVPNMNYWITPSISNCLWKQPILRKSSMWLVSSFLKETPATVVTKRLLLKAKSLHGSVKESMFISYVQVVNHLLDLCNRQINRRSRHGNRTIHAADKICRHSNMVRSYRWKASVTHRIMTNKYWRECL